MSEEDDDITDMIFIRSEFAKKLCYLSEMYQHSKKDEKDDAEKMYRDMLHEFINLKEIIDDLMYKATNEGKNIITKEEKTTKKVRMMP